jgi:hypothetical protein
MIREKVVGLIFVQQFLCVNFLRLFGELHSGGGT